jgi:hypothetical protein
VLGDGVVSGGGVGVVLPGAGFCVDGGFCVPLVGLVVELPLCPDEGALLPGVCAIAQAPHANITANIIILIFICQPPLLKINSHFFPRSSSNPESFSDPGLFSRSGVFRIDSLAIILQTTGGTQVSGINLRFKAELS